MTSTDQYPIMEHFYTLQGEGKYSGRAAYFIRLGGCDVGCHWCDVKESWDKDAHPSMSVSTIVNLVLESGANFAVITGGEPAMYNLDALTNGLKERGIEVAIETSGAYPYSGSWHWICFSPKKFKKPLDIWYEKAHELKVIIFNKSDFEWAESHANKINEHCSLYLQVEWDQSEKMLPEIIQYIKCNPKWKLSVQSHKYIGIP